MPSYLERAKKHRKVLEDLTNEALVLELLNGKVYAGLVDECYYDGGLVIALYGCKLLKRNTLNWVDHDIKVSRDGKLVADVMPDFWVEDIRNILALREEFRDKFDLDDVMQIYIDPYYKPLIGVPCKWNDIHVFKHHAECDERLHEALYNVVTHWASDDEKEEHRKRFIQDCDYITRRLLMSGERIPRIR